VITYGSITAWSKEGNQEAEEQEEVIPAGRGAGRGPRLEALRSEAAMTERAQKPDSPIIKRLIEREAY